MIVAPKHPAIAMSLKLAISFPKPSQFFDENYLGESPGKATGRNGYNIVVRMHLLKAKVVGSVPAVQNWYDGSMALAMPQQVLDRTIELIGGNCFTKVRMGKPASLSAAFDGCDLE